MSPRPPAFLSAHPAAAVPRPAPFAAPPGRVPGRAVRPGGRGEPPPPDPAEVQAELDAVRKDAAERVAQAVEMLRLQGERLAEQARSDALELGFLVARRVLEAELATSPEALFALVKGALRKVGESRKVSVRLHPEDARQVSAAHAGGQLGLTVAAVEIAADPALERGDCVVDADFGRVDGRLRTRLEELQRAARQAAEEGVA